jgi:Domain of unknown function (DUF4386)
MRPARSVGRIVGVLLFAQLAVLTLGFISLLPIATPAFLAEAAGSSFQIRAAVLLLFASGALTVGIAVAGFPIFREQSWRLALSFLALSVIWFSAQAVDNVHILSMLSLSQRHVEGGAANAELSGALAELARSSRRWAHYTGLLVIDGWFFVFYGLLFRLSLVPRALAGFGLAMVAVHTAGITLPVFLGYSNVLETAYSLTLSYLAVGGWLAAKGFAERPPSLSTDARAGEPAGG